MATVGLTEAQLRERGIGYHAADYPFDDHGKSILMEAKYGYVKVLADKDHIVVGVRCFRMHAENVRGVSCNSSVGIDVDPP